MSENLINPYEIPTLSSVHTKRKKIRKQETLMY